MTKFNVSFDEKMVIATIGHDTRGFALARNGEPRLIFCHINDGVYRIIVRGDLLVPDYNCRTTFFPQSGDRLVIVKAPYDPAHKHDKALVWAPLSAYHQAVEFRNRTATIYVATAVNFRDNGKFVTGRREELFRGNEIKLQRLAIDERNKLIDHYSTTLVVGGKRRTFTYDTTWKKVVNGEEVECDSPLAELALH